MALDRAPEMAEFLDGLRFKLQKDDTAGNVQLLVAELTKKWPDVQREELVRALAIWGEVNQGRRAEVLDTLDRTAKGEDVTLAPWMPEEARRIREGE